MAETLEMTPLERAARAVGELQPMDRHEADDIVRAVLQAIREPSEGMKAAGCAPDCDSVEGGELEAEQVWQAMINAALEEGS